MPDSKQASPVQIALGRFWRVRSAQIGVWVVVAFALIGIYAPFLASETALIWSDAAGLHFPVLGDLFNRLAFPERYDLFFNLLSLTLPLGVLVWVVLRKRFSIGVLIRYFAVGNVVLWVLLQVPLLSPTVEGGDRRSIWTERALIGHTYTGLKQVERLQAGGVAEAAQRRDLLLTTDGELVRVMFKTRKPVATDGSAILGDAPEDAEKATFIVVQPDGEPDAEPRYMRPDALQTLGVSFALFPPISHNHDRPYPGAVLATPLTTNESTGLKFWLGADAGGQDILARMCYGARISLTIGVVATVIAMSIGIVIGAISGYFGGWVDILLQRIVEIMMCFPAFLLVLVIVAMVGRDIMVIMLIFGLTGWAGTARLVRGEFLSQMGREYVLACQAMGLPRWRIMFKHILPNALTPLFISAAFSVAGMILSESGLSFLGLVDSRTPSWGLILSAGRQSPEYAHIIYAPGLAIFAMVSALNIIGNGLREAFDPKAAGR